MVTRMSKSVVADQKSHWIAEQRSRIVFVEELDCVPEAFFVGVGEEEFPGLAAVGGFVEAGLVAGAGGHDDGGVFVEGLDAAEVEFFGSGRDGAGLPEVAAVFGAEDGAVGAAGPGDSAADVVDAAEAGGGVGGFHVELCAGLRCGESDGEKKGGGSHLVISVSVLRETSIVCATRTNGEGAFEINDLPLGSTALLCRPQDSQLLKVDFIVRAIRDAIANGKSVPAPNNVNPTNGATRYISPRLSMLAEAASNIEGTTVYVRLLDEGTEVFARHRLQRSGGYLRVVAWRILRSRR